MMLALFSWDTPVQAKKRHTVLGRKLEAETGTRPVLCLAGPRTQHASQIVGIPIC